MGQKIFSIQLKDHRTGEAILGSGGMCFVATAGGSAKATLLNADGSSLANPVSLVDGHIDFQVADTVTSVDLYGTAPSGHSYSLAGVKPSGPNEISIDKSQNMQAMKIPFDVADQAGDATETPSGFVVPSGAVLLPSPAINVVTADVGETIDVGTEGTSNDPNGILAVADVGTAGFVKGTLLSTGQTIGALLSADESGAGVLVPEGNVSAQADNDSISWTLTAGSDTAAGFISLPYMLA